MNPRSVFRGALGVTVAAWLLGCVDLGTTAPDAASPTDAEHDSASDAGPLVEVRITPMAYDPKQVRISPGATIRWTNTDTMPHSATEGRPGSAAAPVWSSPVLAAGEYWEHTFVEQGTWTYYCVLHSGTMQGAVVEVR